MACVDYLRARQIEMSSTPQGCYVDTRGYVPRRTCGTCPRTN
jgi:hypothetical protein